MNRKYSLPPQKNMWSKTLNPRDSGNHQRLLINGTLSRIDANKNLLPFSSSASDFEILHLDASIDFIAEKPFAYFER